MPRPALPRISDITEPEAIYYGIPPCPNGNPFYGYTKDGVLCDPNTNVAGTKLDRLPELMILPLFMLAASNRNLGPYSLGTMAIFAFAMMTHRVSLVAVIAMGLLALALWAFDSAPIVILQIGSWLYHALLGSAAGAVQFASNVPLVGNFIGLGVWAVLFPFMWLVQWMGSAFGGVFGGLFGTLLLWMTFGPFGLLMGLLTQLRYHGPSPAMRLLAKLGRSTEQGGIPVLSEIVRNLPALGTLMQRAPAPPKIGCNGKKDASLGEPLWRDAER